MQRRDSARAILLNADDEALLLDYENESPVDPANPHILRYWVTPGGGREEGESFEDALRRELFEELGCVDVVVGDLIGVREKTLELPGRGIVLSHEEYYVCHPVAGQPISHDGLSDDERRVLRGARWWRAADLVDEEAVVRPPALVELIRLATRRDEPRLPMRFSE